MHVRQIMTRDPLTVAADDSLDTAMAMIDENGFRHVPVVDGAQLVGVLSDRDLLEATGWLPAAERAEDAPRTVRELLAGEPVVVSPDDSVVMAAVDLTSRSIGSLPVVEGGALVGILTELDLLRAFGDLCSQEGGLTGLHRAVTELMIEDPVTIGPEATLGDAFALEARRRIRHLPVLEGERLVGVVSDRDLRRARGRGLGEATPVRELMTESPETLAPGDSLLEATRRVLAGHFSSLPIVAEDRLVGILTVTDLLCHCVTNLRNPDR